MNQFQSGARETTHGDTASLYPNRSDAVKNDSFNRWKLASNYRNKRRSSRIRASSLNRGTGNTHSGYGHGGYQRTDSRGMNFKSTTRRMTIGTTVVMALTLVTIEVIAHHGIVQWTRRMNKLMDPTNTRNVLYAKRKQRLRSYQRKQ